MRSKYLYSWYEFNKDAKVLEIDLKDKSNTTFGKAKYDYIILNNVDSENIDKVLSRAKNSLTNDGKVLFDIHNSFGINEWCSYRINSEDFLSKNILIEKFKEMGFYYNFYYIFPNAINPEIMITDEYVNKGKTVPYAPVYYGDDNDIIINECDLYNKLCKGKIIDFFANDYVIELGLKQNKKSIFFAKYNESRRDKYKIITYYKKNRYYKKGLTDLSKEFLSEYYDNSKWLNNFGYKVVKLTKENDEVYSDENQNISIYDYIEENKKDLKKVKAKLNSYYEYLKKQYSKDNILTDKKDNCFKKNNIEYNEEDVEKMHFLKIGYIDIIPQNVLIVDKEYCLIDQEWKMKNVPIEYIMYRAIVSISPIFLNAEIFNNLLEEYNLTNYAKLFENLEVAFIDEVFGSSFGKLEENKKFTLVDIDDMKYENMKKDKVIKELEESLRNITNSKGWKILEKLRKLKPGKK